MYNSVFTKSFSNDVKDIKKDNVLFQRLKKKIDEILENPEHYGPKKYKLKGKRSAHVGSFVILFEIKEKDVVFLKFKHHDYVYD
ncbi:addiction module toxin RelE [Candidatus Woesearchaeota archaeon]|jgi:mRNA-degrading endonuclease RelE of RelBE toxin-antitoxin system|nr:addiction module toxin RelE [Candidatus Woesearchaeota archaeon]|tara:strand:+ start:603 stop:854 length:252 start_codon:yes stop_codon:yes gene_type:complete